MTHSESIAVSAAHGVAAYGSIANAIDPSIGDRIRSEFATPDRFGRDVFDVTVSRLSKNSVIARLWMAATTNRSRKRLIRREPVRTCAGLAT